MPSELAARNFRASDQDEKAFLRGEREKPYRQDLMDAHRNRGRDQLQERVDDLTDADIRAMEKMLQPDYEDINEAFRAGDPRVEQAPIVRVATSAMNKLPDFEGEVHRGIRFDTEGKLEAFLERYRPGGTVSEPAFTHSDKAVDVAEQFLGTPNTPGRVILHIDARHGKDLTFLRRPGIGHQEVMYPPHTTFYPTERWQDADGIWHVKVRDYRDPADGPVGDGQSRPQPGTHPGRPEAPDTRAYQQPSQYDGQQPEPVNPFDSGPPQQTQFAPPSQRPYFEPSQQPGSQYGPPYQQPGQPRFPQQHPGQPDPYAPPRQPDPYGPPTQHPFPSQQHPGQQPFPPQHQPGQPQEHPGQPPYRQPSQYDGQQPYPPHQPEGSYPSHQQPGQPPYQNQVHNPGERPSEYNPGQQPPDYQPPWHEAGQPQPPRQPEGPQQYGGQPWRGVPEQGGQAPDPGYQHESGYHPEQLQQPPYQGFGPQGHGPYGAPHPPESPYGQPDQHQGQQPQQGAPPQQYGGQPQSYGSQPNPYGAQPDSYGSAEPYGSSDPQGAVDPDSSSGSSGSVEQSDGSVPRRPNSDFPVGPPTYHDFVANPETPQWVEDFYVSMRTETADVPKVAEAAGLDPALVEVAKRNLFVNAHDVPIAAGDLRRGYFTPIQHIAELWTAAMDGKVLTSDQVRELRSLIAHEYVEARLLEAGVPYRFADPELWKDDFYDFSREHAGAHEVAPKSLQGSEGVNLLRHWEALKLKPPRGGLAPDLSNLDDVVRFAKEGMGW